MDLSGAGDATIRGSRKRYSTDTPRVFHGRVGVKLKELDEDEGTKGRFKGGQIFFQTDKLQNILKR